MVKGGRGDAGEGGALCCSSSIGRNSRTWLSAVFDVGLDPSSSAIGLSVLTASHGGGRPGKDAQ
jgi:hypothetical protein